MASPYSIGQKRGAETDLTPNGSPNKSHVLKELPTTAPLMSKDTDPTSLPDFSSIDVNNEDSGVTCSDDPPQQRSQPENVSQPTSAGSFFSLPIELRNEIYRYLRPQRIHIAPPFNVQEDHHTKPWALIAVCRQLRDESRAVAYPETPIDIYLSELSKTTAYETWIDGLHEGLEASIRHIGIDGFIDIDWVHDGPMPERPQDRRKRLEFEHLTDVERLYGGHRKPRTCANCDDYMGDWKVRWLYHCNQGADFRTETIYDLLDVMDERITKLNTPMGGLGKDGIRTLVASYQYAEAFGTDYGEEYGEGSEDREDLKEAHEQEHEKEVDGSSKKV
ncbi:MAG: hypothetical protein Q9180_000253 [Flavoplaca navasiana]